MTTPDQYRRDGAEAMRKAALEACEDYAPERNVDFPTDPFIAQIAQVTHSMDRIRALDVDDVLAGKPPAPDPVARLVEAARAALNYLENTEGEFGITLESATDIRTALAAMETSHDHT